MATNEKIKTEEELRTAAKDGDVTKITELLEAGVVIVLFVICFGSHNRFLPFSLRICAEVLSSFKISFRRYP